MSYLYDKKRKKKKRIIFVALALFLVLFFTSILSRIYDLFERPVLSAYQNTKETKEGFNFLLDMTTLSKKDLIDYNRLLQTEIERMHAEVAFVDFHKDLSLNSNGIAASIVDRSFVKDSYVLINKGEKDGLVLGDYVFARDYILIGEVVEVFDLSSRVLLYSQDAYESPAVLFPHNIPIQLIGSGSAYVVDVDRSVELVAGDVVYSEEFPGYTLGLVRDIQFDPRDPFKKAFVSAPVNIHEITSVEVRKKTTNSS